MAPDETATPFPNSNVTDQYTGKGLFDASKVLRNITLMQTGVHEIPI